MATERSLPARSYWRAVLRRPWLVAVIPLLIVVTAVGGVLRSPDRYAATVTMRVATPGSISGEAVRGDALTYLDRLQNTYASLARSRPLRTKLARQLHLPERPEISVSPHPASELMDITVTTSSPASAQEAANAAAWLLIEAVRELERERYGALEAGLKTGILNLEVEVAKARDDRDSLARNPSLNDAGRARIRQLETDIDIKLATLSEQQARYEQVRALLLGRDDVLSVAVPASRPSSPEGPALPLVVAVSLALGVVTAVGVAAIFERLRTRVATREEVEHVATAPVVAQLHRSSTGQAIITDGDGSADGFRRLRTELLIKAERQGLRSIVVTHPDGEGDSGWVATNLAVALAQAGQRVLLVDGDVASPTLHLALTEENEVGLAEVLLDEASPDAASQSTSVPNLSLLSAGVAGRKATDNLTPGRVAKTVAGLEILFEVVVVKAPPVLATGDSRSFSAAVSGTLLVVTRDLTKASEIAQACEELRNSDAVLFGVVLTDTTGRRER
jgi:capsular exopolysaccharide synthesis family protein